MAEERNWEDLQTDCLVNIFARLNVETVVLNVQFVCYTWFQATLNPQCWQNLVFTERTCFDECVEYATIGRSNKSAPSVIFEFGSYFTDQSLLLISKSCPLLKNLALPPTCSVQLQSRDSPLSKLIHNWKNLECLTIYAFNLNCHAIYNFGYIELLESISLHCKNFIHFSCHETDIDVEEAFLIVQYLPKIKVLRMNDCFIYPLSLLIILKCCSELEYVDVGDCDGFDEDDDEIMDLAMHIKFFNSQSSGRRRRWTK